MRRLKWRAGSPPATPDVILVRPVGSQAIQPIRPE
jgi:hypothetical protein